MCGLFRSGQTELKVARVTLADMVWNKYCHKKIVVLHLFVDAYIGLAEYAKQAKLIFKPVNSNYYIIACALLHLHCSRLVIIFISLGSLMVKDNKHWS